MSDALLPNPAEELSEFTMWASMLFFAAEEGHNPQVQTFWDAYHYVATSLSVGYANMFPVTQPGKIIGAVVMMVGPAMCARALDQPTGAGQAEVVAKLDELLSELRRLNLSNQAA